MLTGDYPRLHRMPQIWGCAAVAAALGALFGFRRRDLTAA
jgi:hypothetical protein